MTGAIVRAINHPNIVDLKQPDKIVILEVIKARSIHATPMCLYTQGAACVGIASVSDFPFGFNIRLMAEAVKKNPELVKAKQNAPAGQKRAREEKGEEDRLAKKQKTEAKGEIVVSGKGEERTEKARKVRDEKEKKKKKRREREEKDSEGNASDKKKKKKRKREIGETTTDVAITLKAGEDDDGGDFRLL